MRTTNKDKIALVEKLLSEKKIAIEDVHTLLDEDGEFRKPPVSDYPLLPPYSINGWWEWVGSGFPLYGGYWKFHPYYIPASTGAPIPVYPPMGTITVKADQNITAVLSTDWKIPINYTDMEHPNNKLVTYTAPECGYTSPSVYAGTSAHVMNTGTANALLN